MYHILLDSALQDFDSFLLLQFRDAQCHQCECLLAVQMRRPTLTPSRITTTLLFPALIFVFHLPHPRTPIFLLDPASWLQLAQVFVLLFIDSIIPITLFTCVFTVRFCQSKIFNFSYPQLGYNIVQCSLHFTRVMAAAIQDVELMCY